MFDNYIDIFTGYSRNENILLTAFIVLFLWRFFYLLLFTGRILFLKSKKPANSVKTPVSLIMTIRNEQENLKKNIPAIFATDNTGFEIVIVDDFSQDESFQVLGLLKDRYKRLTISGLNQETRFSSKLAQNIAIKGAKNEWVLNIPVSVSKKDNEWPGIISEYAGNRNNAVIAFCSIEKSKGIYNLLVRIENFMMYIKSTSYILNGIPLVYSDENIAFKKQKYFDQGGYGHNMNEFYVNLELIVNRFIRKKTTTVLFGKKSSVRKNENADVKYYLDLLKKSIRTEKYLSFPKQLFLAVDEFGKLIFVPFSVFVIVLFPELWEAFVVLFGIQIVARLFIIKMLQNRLNERKIFIPSLLYDLIMPYFRLFFRWHFNRRVRKRR